MSTIEAIDFAARVVLAAIVLVGWSRLNDLEEQVLTLEQFKATAVAGADYTFRLLREQDAAIDRLEDRQLATIVDPYPRLYGRDPLS